MATVTSTTPGPANVYSGTAIPSADARRVASCTPNASSRSQRRVLFNSSSWQSDKDAAGFQIPSYYSGAPPWHPIAQDYLPAHALDSGYVDISWSASWAPNTNNHTLLWRPYIASVDEERDASRTSYVPHNAASAAGFGWTNTHLSSPFTSGQTYRVRCNVRLQGLGKDKSDPVLEMRGKMEALQLSSGNAIGKDGDGSGIIEYHVWHLIDGVDLWQPHILGVEFSSTLDNAASTDDLDSLHIDNITGVLDCITLGKEH